MTRTTFASTVVLQFSIYMTIATNPRKLGTVMGDEEDFKKHEKLKRYLEEEKLYGNKSMLDPPLPHSALMHCGETVEYSSLLKPHLGNWW